MTHQFIVWLKKDDVAFRAAYLAKTGEKIAAYPQESEDGLSCMTGSWRVSEQQLDELKADTKVFTKPSDLVTNKNAAPVGWVRKAEVV